MTHNVMYCFTSKLKIFCHLLYANVRILRLCLVLLHTVDPDVNIPVGLLDGEFSQRYAVLLSLRPL